MVKGIQSDSFWSLLSDMMRVMREAGLLWLRLYCNCWCSCWEAAEMTWSQVCWLSKRLWRVDTMNLEGIQI